MVKAALAYSYWKQGWDGEWYKAYPEVIGRASNRIGPTGQRTMHIRVQSVGKQTGGVAKAIAGLSYDKREGRDHRSRVDELETDGGRTTEEMTTILMAVDKAVTRKNGQLALDYEIELPIAMTAEARQVVGERIAQHFEGQGVPCHWAIHSHNERGELQPHLHMTTTSRAVTRGADGEWQVATRGTTVINGPKGMQAFRRDVVARAINEVAAEHGIELGATWHGGRLAETGIERPAKRRRPMIAVKRELAATRDDRGLARTNAHIDAGDYDTVIDARAAFVEREKAARAARVEREAEARASALAANARIDQVPGRKQRKVTERPFRLATAGQRRVILEMVQETGVALPDGVLDQFDGGDLIATLRAVMKTGANAQAALRDGLEKAEARARQAELLTIRAEQMLGDTLTVLAEVQQERDALAQAAEKPPEALHETEIAALVEIRVAKVLRQAVAQQPAIPIDHPDRIEAGRTKQYRIMGRFFGLRSADVVQEDIKITPEMRLASWDSAYTIGVEVGLQMGAAARHDRLSTLLIQTKAQLVDERAKRQAEEDQVALAELAATIKGERVGGTLRADRDAARIENAELRQTVARQNTQISELMKIVHDPDTVLGNALTRTQAAEQEAAALRVASERNAEELDRYASEREGLETRVREAEKRALEASTLAVVPQPPPHLPKTTQTLRERFPHHVFADERTEPTQLVKGLLGEYLMKRIADTKGALAEESLPRTQRGFQLGLQGLTHWAIQLGALEPRAATPTRPLSLDGGNSL